MQKKYVELIDQSCTQAHIVSAIKINQDNEILNTTIQNMLKAAVDYMLKLSNSWVRDSVPDASVPFSNQVNI